MSVVQVPRSSQEQQPSLSVKYPPLRLLLLCALLLISVALYLLLGALALPHDEYIMPFLLTWTLCFLPYLAACAFVLTTSPSTAQWRGMEVSVILLGAFIFRVMLLPQMPWLSHDSWRYLWDARIILHGYSPYVYPPNSEILKPLRDALIYGNSGFLDVPTVYPPVAQGVYVLSYLLAPSNLFVLKTIFICLDMVTCAGLALLLMRRGLDPRRVVIYAWCPLPIVEFAIEGHVDALTLTLIVLTLLCTSSSRRDTRIMRVLTGFLIALATLTKIYPILLLVVVVRRRDWALLITCFATIVVAYIPFIILGHGQAFGFFSTYASEQRQNAGVVPLVVHWITYDNLRLNDQVTVLVQYCVDLLVVGTVVMVVLIKQGSVQLQKLVVKAIVRISTFTVGRPTRGLPGRAKQCPAPSAPYEGARMHPCYDEEDISLRSLWFLRGSISMESAALVLIGTIYAVSTHIFPWYTPVLLLWVPLLAGPLWTSRGLSGKGVAVAAVWYFVCTSLLGYFFRNTLDWTLYYIFVYGIVVVALGVTAVIAVVGGSPLHSSSHND